VTSDAAAVTILDGGMGQELVRRSGREPTGLWATQVMIDAPHLVREIHDDYFAAGAQIATANTYALHRDRLEPAGQIARFEELHHLACEQAVLSRDAHGSGRVAGALGPLEWSYRGDDGPPFAIAAQAFAEIAAIQNDYVELYLIETVTSLARARAALEGTLGHGKPVWLAISVDDDDGTRLRSGEPVARVPDLLDDYPFAALLVNCSIPEAVGTAVAQLKGAPVPVGAYANGFNGISQSFLSTGSAVDKLRARTDLDPAAYAAFAARWVEDGATIIGGCCEVGPAHIRALSTRFAA